MDSHRQSTVYNRYATLIFTNPVFLGFSRYQNVKFGSQRDNFSRTKISRKAHFSRVTEVVECRQMCWNLHRMQHICNKDIDMYRTFFSRNTGECPFLFYLINRIYELLYIEVGIYFFCQSHSSRVSHNPLNNCISIFYTCKNGKFYVSLCISQKAL